MPATDGSRWLSKAEYRSPRQKLRLLNALDHVSRITRADVPRHVGHRVLVAGPRVASTAPRRANGCGRVTRGLDLLEAVDPVACRG